MTNDIRWVPNLQLRVKRYISKLSKGEESIAWPLGEVLPPGPVMSRGDLFKEVERLKDTMWMVRNLLFDANVYKPADMRRAIEDASDMLEKALGR